MEEKIRSLGSLHANHFSVHLHDVRLKTGEVSRRIKVEHPPAAAVVPFLDAERILMVRQWRYAVGRETLEIPAGKLDEGEDPPACARRELREETGYEAGRLLSLFSYYPAIGYSDEVIEIFAASGLTRASEERDEREISGLREVKLDEIYDLILEGTVRDGKTVLGLALLDLRRRRGDVPGDFFV